MSLFLFSSNTNRTLAIKKRGKSPFFYVLDSNPDLRIIRHINSTQNVLVLTLGPRLGRPPSHTDKSSFAHGERILMNRHPPLMNDDSIRFSWSASFRLQEYIRAFSLLGFIQGKKPSDSS